MTALPQIAKRSRNAASVSRRDYVNQQKKIQTRRDLLRAARILFSQNGYQLTSPDAIACLAGVSHGTFYTYFKDKLECFLAFADEALYEMYLVNKWYEPLDDLPEATLHAVFKSTFEYSLLNPGIVRAVLVDFNVLMPHAQRGKKQTPFIKGYSWIPKIQRWQQQGHVDPNIDAKSFVYLLAGAIKQGEAIIARNPEMIDQITDSFSVFLTRALHPS